MDVLGDHTGDRVDVGRDHEMRRSLDRRKRAVDVRSEQRVGALHRGVASPPRTTHTGRSTVASAAADSGKA